MSESTAVQVIDAISDKLGIIVDWTQENVMPVAEDLAKMYITKCTVRDITIMVLLTLGSVVLWLVAVYCYKVYKSIITLKDQRYYNDDEVMYAIIGASAAVFAGIVTLVLFVLAPDKISSIVTPEMYLLELIKSF